MKWWGWGDEGVSFTHEDKPALGPFLERHLDIDVSRAVSRPTAFDALQIPEPSLAPDLAAALETAVGDVSTDPLDRVVHARGKSLRDLVRHRRGDLGRLPDVVVRPADEDEVVGGHARRPGRRRGAHPLRRRDQHLGQPRAPGAGAAHGHLARRHEAASSTRRGRALRPRPGPGRRVRPGHRAAAQRAGMDARPLPRQLHPLDARRVDRHALFGHAVGPLRRHRRPHTRGARRHAGRAAGDPSGAPHLDRAERAGDGARQRRPPGVITEATVQVRRVPEQPRDPRLPVPDLVRRPRGHARHRGERGGRLGDPRLRRQRDGVLLRHPEGAHRSRPDQVARR